MATLALYLAVGVVLVAAVTVLANSTARLRLAQAFRLYWLWGGIASAATLVAMLVW